MPTWCLRTSAKDRERRLTATGQARTCLHDICNEILKEIEMLRLAKLLLLPLVLFPLHGLAADCEVEARLDDIQIQMCNGERYLGTTNEHGTLLSPTLFDAVPHGLETFWSDLCDCYLWQVSGVAGAHTRVARFYQRASDGRLSLIPGGEFGSEIGKISRISQRSGFIVEVRDSEVGGKRETWARYRFDGKKFSRLRMQ